MQFKMLRVEWTRHSLFLLFLAGALLPGCSAMDVKDFAGKEPRLVLQEYFAGTAEGWGVMQDRFGRLQRQFRIEANGEWDHQAGVLLLTERYRFDDGQVDELHWRIRALGDGRYEGLEERLVGKATGRQAGNAFHWVYQRRVPRKSGERRLNFDDWFWLQPEGILIARASIKRFGFELGTMSVFYRKTGAGSDVNAAPAASGR
jgi:hypothetical protein